jgi:dTDP-4-amino-4,6-dideoxygalactose transaminase
MKNAVDELAIFGGRLSIEEQLHVGSPNIGHRENLIARINDALDRRWLTNDGLFVEELEQRIADKLRVRHCIAMCNGTMALEIVIRAVGMTGEVIMPAFTFVATAHAVQWQGITPVFCDVDPNSHNIDPDQIEALITPRTTGIIGVHLWGRTCNVEALTAIAKKHRLKLLFDAAHAFGCSYQGHMIGNFGNAEVFSFHATKFFNTFEGGAVVTNDDQLAEKIRLMKNFGFSGYDNVIYIGTNGKMSEASAAMGLTGLESLEEFLAHNYRNYKCYNGKLADIPGVQLITYDETEKCNFQYIVLQIDEKLTGINRDQLVEILHAENILVRRYFYPGCHRMEPYRSNRLYDNLVLPVTDRLAQNIISLPTGTAIGQAEINTICQVIRLAVCHGPEVRRRLAEKNAENVHSLDIPVHHHLSNDRVHAE